MSFSQLKISWLVGPQLTYVNITRWVWALPIRLAAAGCLLLGLKAARWRMSIECRKGGELRQLPGCHAKLAVLT